MLCTKAVSYRRGTRALVDSASIEVSPGQLTVVVGPNGAGKSTLLKLLSNDLKPSAGRVTLDGVTLTEWGAPALAKRRAVLPQDSALRFPFTAQQVIEMGRMPLATEASPAVHEAAVQRALARLDLSGLAHQAYPSLSGGERQRVQLARVLAQLDRDTGETRYLLLDEPTSSLDPAHQQRTLEIAREEARAGRGVLAVLHDLNLASRYADRVVVMVDGRVSVQGPVREVITPTCIRETFNIDSTVIAHPSQGFPVVIPA
ncbi:MAG: heme ABC transporter ATP-binding protein [Pseudomonadota bacterium]